jgi:hypothetical protein
MKKERKEVVQSVTQTSPEDIRNICQKIEGGICQKIEGGCCGLSQVHAAKLTTYLV